MAKKVLVVSTSLRGNSNSEILAKECERGAKDGGAVRLSSCPCAAKISGFASDA